eukprot:1790225-Rhodomonas_salina.1
MKSREVPFQAAFCVHTGRHSVHGVPTTYFPCAPAQQYPYQLSCGNTISKNATVLIDDSSDASKLVRVVFVIVILAS